MLCLALIALPELSSGQTLHWQPNALRRFWDLDVNPMEFRTPVLLMPFDVKGTLTVYGGPEMFQGLPLSLIRNDFSVAVLDSTESEFATIQSLFSRLTLIYDLDLIKYNALHRYLSVNMLDILVGVGLRTNQIPFPRRLPSNWLEGEYDYRFAPIFNQGLLNLTLGLQRIENRYAYLQLGKGLAVGSAYRANIIKRYLDGTGKSTDIAVGIKFIRPGSERMRTSWGFELRYSSLNAPDLSDPDLISPVEGLQVRYLGFFVTFGTILGGRSTTADRAKQQLYSGEYMAAEANLLAFLDDYPEHVKVPRAQNLLTLVKGLVPYQQIDIARALQEEGRLEEALTWLDRAETRADTAIMALIVQGRAEVGYVYLQRADNALQQGNLDGADQLLRSTTLLLPEEKVLVDKYDAELLIRRGHLLRSQGAFTSALREYSLAIASDTSRRVEIEGYQVRIAEDLLREAEVASSRDAIALALESLRLSQSLDPRRKAELDQMIADLEDRLDRLAQAEIRQSIEAQMQQSREAREVVAPSEPRFGLTISQLEDILGPPDRVTQTTDSLGDNYQLWEYRGGEFPGLYYFENYILIRME